MRLKKVDPMSQRLFYFVAFANEGNEILLKEPNGVYCRSKFFFLSIYPFQNAITRS